MRFPMKPLAYVYSDRDRHGNVRRYYWRGKGHRKIRLRETPGTEAFAEEYRQAIAAESKGKTAESKTGETREPILAGSWRWLCVQYLASKDFARLDDSTQRVRRQILEGTYDEPVKPGSSLTFAKVPAAKLTAKAVKVLRDRKDGPEAGNGRVKAIRQVFSWALEEEIDGITSNPGRDVKYIKTGSQGFHSWEDDEVEKFEQRHPIGSKARLALDLLLYTGGRRSDAVRFGRQHCRDGELKFTAFKGRNKNPVTIEIPILPILQATIEASPCGDLTFLVTTFGKAFTAAGFGNWFRERCDEAGLPHCSAHGLRKAGARRAAENGATEHELMSIFGWLTPKEAARYTKAARQKLLAKRAMPLLMRGKE